MNKLLIQIREGNFWHRRNSNPLTDRNVSDFEVSIDENFVLVELDGSQSFSYKVVDVTIQVGIGGTIESFTNRLLLIARLQQLGYTPYLNANGLNLNDLNVIKNQHNFGKFSLVRHAINNTGAEILFDDLAHGQIDNETYCLLGRYKNSTNDNNPDNPLNYELLSTSGLTSQ